MRASPAGVLLAGLALAGCSLIAVTPVAAPAPAHERVECTETYAAPVVDTVLATAGVGLTAAILGDLSIHRGDQDDDGASKGIALSLLLVTGASGLVSTLSAVHGYRAVAECRAAAHAPLANGGRCHVCHLCGNEHAQ